MFERFTDSARRVVVLSQEEARELVHNYIGTEHVLLGLFHARSDQTDQALVDTLPAIPMARVRQEVTKIVPLGNTGAAPGHIPFTPRAKRVLEQSLREATQAGQNSIGAVHLLAAVLCDPESTAMAVLTGLGIDIEQLATSVHQATPQAPPAQQRPAPIPVGRLDVLEEQVRRLTEQVEELRRRLDETGRRGEG
ncbi:MAG TPA: Clp protease N-terminal domain-containing protein [Pseudonocardiaceae bacterium]|jgi:ATP-dependent Clp protease ATP-binding subunit ClpC